MKAVRWILFALATTAIPGVAPLAAIYSADELLRLGNEAWQHNQCVKAAEYLFAYQQKNPPALQSNAEHRSNVATSIAWCEQHARLSGGGSADDPNAHSPANAGPPRPQVSLSAPAAAADKRCDIYARLAVAQNETNGAAHCGLSGGRWSSDYGYHYNWCVHTPSAETRSESLTRTTMLNECTP